MKVVVDGFNLALEKGTGVATYARNLTYSLRDAGCEVDVLYGGRMPPDKTPLMREIAFFDENAGAKAGPRRSHFLMDAAFNHTPRHAYEVPLSGAVIYRQYQSRFPHYDRIWNSPYLFDKGNWYFRLHRRPMKVGRLENADIAHWTYPLPVAMAETKNVYTLHDLVPLRLPFTTLDRKKQYLRLLKSIVATSDHIVTVSETSRRDIIDILGAPEHKITNTYQSVSIPQKYLSIPFDTLREELIGNFQLEPKKYLLFYGSLEPKKNIGRTIEAYLASNLDMPLVIVGAQAWKADQELKLLNNAHAARTSKHKIVQFDYVTFPQLVSLIRGAIAVTFPSLYEGFGLPILEGMLCGTPVITSNLGAMKEIGGDAAIFVDPYDPRSIKEAMLGTVHNSELRNEKIARGYAVAQRFSQEAYQKRLVEVYKRLSPQAKLKSIAKANAVPIANVGQRDPSFSV